MLFTALWTKSVPKESIITFIPSQEVRSSCESITLVLLNFCVPSHLLILLDHSDIDKPFCLLSFL